MKNKALLRTIIALATGLALSVWLLQNNQFIQKKAISHLIALLEKEWDSSISLQAYHINLFTQKIQLKQGSIQPKKYDCSWQFDYCCISTNLFTLLFKKKLPLYVTINNVTSTTSIVDTHLALEQHLTAILTPHKTAIKIRPQNITIQTISVTANYKNHSTHLFFDGQFSLIKNKNLPHQKFANPHKKKSYPEWKGLITGNNSFVTLNSIPIMKNIQSTITFNKTVSDKEWLKQTIIKGSLITPQKIYPVTIKNKGQTFIITNNTDHINLACLFTKPTTTLKGTLPAPLLEYWYHIIGHDQKAYKPVTTDEINHIDIALTQTANGPSITGNIQLNNNPLLPLLACNNITLKNNIFSASLQATSFNNVPFSAQAQWNLIEQKGTFSITNKERVGLYTPEQPSTNKWYIEKQEATLRALVDSNKKVKGKFSIPLHNALSHETVSFKGSFTADLDAVHIRGTIFDDTFLSVIKLFPHPHITRFEYITEENDQQLASFKQRKDNPFVLQGTVSFAAIQALFNQDMKHTILGEKSAFSVAIDQTCLTNILCSFSLSQGSLYIPESHNLIEQCSLTAKVDIKGKKLWITDGNLTFHKGSIRCPQAIMAWNDNFSLENIHIPLEINDLFINWKKDLYAFVYGNILVNKKPTMPTSLTGSLFLKKSLLKNNIFSENTNDRMYLPIQTMPFSQEQMRIKLTIATESPIKIKTPALSTQANIALQIKHSYHKTEFNIPHVSGVITLDRGSLKLLHNRLFIEYGRLEFPAYQTNDPIIDLTAKNRIHKYLITLHATGSLQKPNIILESVPELPEEQILGLLLGGSETTSLQQDLPAILLQNLNAILIGTTNLPPKTNILIELLTKPLKYVQIIPNFTDQSGRGGIKGTISVDINKQLHAQFQKNFNLQEDFSFQVEYLLSDDINIKAVKDQRGELGAEVELRLKF